MISHTVSGKRGYVFARLQVQSSILLTEQLSVT